MSETKLCPITGETVEFHWMMTTKGLGNRYVHGRHEVAISESGEYALQGAKWLPESPALTEDQIRNAISLLRSRFWRVRRGEGRDPFVTTRDHRRFIEEHPEKQNPDLLKYFHIICLEDAESENASLAFTTRCFNTLENLFDVWRETGTLPEIGYRALDDKSRSLFNEREGVSEAGMAYGCDERLAPMVYRWLFDKGFLRDRIISDQNRGLELTPDALVEVERIRAGREASVLRGFFIRRFDEEMDAFYRPLLDGVEQATGCAIHAVWERSKNEKLDELILRRIRESSVIVLDVTGERFNVGLEAGYAIAMRKQIVLVRDVNDKGHELPFDIRTLNCFFYDRAQPESLRDKLIERVLDAIEEARHGTH